MSWMCRKHTGNRADFVGLGKPCQSLIKSMLTFNVYSRTQRHMWVEFVVDSLPCFKGFSPCSPVFLHSQKSPFPNSNSTRNRGPSENYLCDNDVILVEHGKFIFLLFNVYNDHISSIAFFSYRNDTLTKNQAVIYLKCNSNMTLNESTFQYLGIEHEAHSIYVSILYLMSYIIS
jgi:hypothetical protein